MERSASVGTTPLVYDFYLWNNDDGYNKLGDWVEKVAKGAGH